MRSRQHNSTTEQGYQQHNSTTTQQTAQQRRAINRAGLSTEQGRALFMTRHQM